MITTMNGAASAAESVSQQRSVAPDGSTVLSVVYRTRDAPPTHDPAPRRRGGRDDWHGKNASLDLSSGLLLANCLFFTYRVRTRAVCRRS